MLRDSWKIVAGVVATILVLGLFFFIGPCGKDDSPAATTSGQANGSAPSTSVAAPAAPQLPLLLRFAEGDAEGCQEILISWSARVTPLGGPVVVYLPGPGGKPADKPAGVLHPDRPGEVNFGTVETGVWRFCPEDANASWGVEVDRR